MKTSLSGISETLLIPLWARAEESRREGGIIRDPNSVEIVEAVNYDFSRFEGSWMSQLGVAVRVEILDREVGNFLAQHPEALIVNLGAGLDTRFSRMDNGRLTWMDLDLPEVIEWRQRFFNQSERYRMIPKSVLDFSWIEEIAGKGKPVLLIAEGLLMYLQSKEVRTLFETLPSYFPGGVMLCEILGPALVGRSWINDSISRIEGAKFSWSIKNSRQLERWNSGIRFVEEWFYTDYHRERWKWFGKVTRVRFLRDQLSNRIAHLRFI